MRGPVTATLVLALLVPPAPAIAAAAPTGATTSIAIAAAAAAVRSHLADPGRRAAGAAAALRSLEVANDVLTASGPVAVTNALAGLPAIPAPARYATPSAALRALAVRHGIAFDRTKAAALDDLGTTATARLLDFLDAFVAFDATAATAYAGLNVADLSRRARDHDAPPGLGAMGPRLDAVAAARAGFVATIAPLAGALAGVTPAHRTAATISLCPLVAFDLLGGDDAYEQWNDCILVLDVGGNDTYRNNAGGTGISTLLAQPCQLTGYLGAAALVDLAGNDSYTSGRDCGQNGGAHSGGAGFLFDAQGDDTYSAGSYGTNGGGFVGSGFLYDAGGYATYAYGGHEGVNGGAVTGSGTFVDAAHNAAFGAGDWGTNGGAYAGGTGALVRLGDRYTSVSGGSYGTNGGGCGGAGMLVDSGNVDGGYFGGGYADTGTNGGAHGSDYQTPGCDGGAGLLVDGTGPLNLYGDNGGATAEGVGVLVGSEGPGYYSGRNGGAVNDAVGVLVDPGGDDRYDAGYGGTNGGGVYGGAGYLHDMSGDDTYYAGRCAVNGGGWSVASCYGSAASAGTGELIDDAGRDSYTDGDGGSGSDVTVAAKGTAGMQLDGPSRRPGPPTLFVAGPVTFTGTADLPTFPCPPPPPLGTGPCQGSFHGDWAATVSGTRDGEPFSATWTTTGGQAIDVTFDYSEWNCLAGTETVLGIAKGHGTATVAPGQIQGKWQVTGESFPRDVVGANLTFDFTWDRIAGTALITLDPLALTLDVSGLGTKVVGAGPQTGVATLVVRSTDNTTVPTCATPLTNVVGDIAGALWVAS